MDRPALHILVTCTKRKRFPAPAALLFRNNSGKSPRARLLRWTRALDAPLTKLLPAEELYAGDQWTIARALPAAAPTGVAARLWICSAGYGLIPGAARAQPYSATFSQGHPDSVRRPQAPGGVTDLAWWWEHLAEWEGPAPGEPRTLTELTRRGPDIPLLVVASPAYLRVLAADLLSARALLADPELLTIVSAGGSSSGRLGRNCVPCDARLQTVLGGALMSLNVRIARRLLQECAPERLTCAAFREQAEGLMAGRTQFQALRRRGASDVEVGEFIASRLLHDSTLSHSRLLREWRAAGRACEQKRFRLLFQHAQGNLHD